MKERNDNEWAQRAVRELIAVCVRRAVAQLQNRANAYARRVR